MKNRTKDMVVGKRLKKRSGYVIIKEQVILGTETHQPYFREVDRQQYLSVQERKQLIKMLSVKWKVNDVRYFVSVMPDC